MGVRDKKNESSKRDDDKKRRRLYDDKKLSIGHVIAKFCDIGISMCRASLVMQHVELRSQTECCKKTYKQSFKCLIVSKYV
jgi:hypothetical protein